MPRKNFLLALEGTGAGLMVGAAVAMYREPADNVGGLILVSIGFICFLAGEILRR